MEGYLPLGESALKVCPCPDWPVSRRRLAPVASMVCANPCLVSLSDAMIGIVMDELWKVAEVALHEPLKIYTAVCHTLR